MSIVVLNTLRGMIESGAELDKTTAAILLLAAAQFATADAMWVWLLAKLYSKLFRIRDSLVKEIDMLNNEAKKPGSVFDDHTGDDGYSRQYYINYTKSKLRLIACVALGFLLMKLIKFIF